MKPKSVCIIVILLGYLLFAIPKTSPAENQALEQLLEIFQKKGLISSEEVLRVKESIAKDKARLQKKEKELDEREKAVIEREEALKQREERLGTRDEQRREEAFVPAASDMPKVEAKFEEGFWLTTKDKDKFSLRIGGTLQADYRHYDYGDIDPQKNGFDIRRARLFLMGDIYKYIGYRFLYEFQGASSRKLLDAYVNVRLFPFLNFRIGQFKSPFSLQWYTLDTNLYFNERAMGIALTPLRDVGLMYYGEAWKERIDCRLGVFNGDGGDDATGGETDDPVLTGRLVLSPFKNRNIPLFDQFQIGGSFNFGRMGRNNVQIQAKTAGMTTFFDVQANKKFTVIQSAGEQIRTGLELGWAYGPLMLNAEYIHLLFRDVETSSGRFDIPVTSYYASLVWMITGEEPGFYRGVLKRVRPLRPIGGGGWGALALALRYDVFEADESVYKNVFDPKYGYSVREAKAYTIALNWYLNTYARFMIDATRTNFDMPLLIYRDEVAHRTLYSDREDVLTVRFQLHF